MADYVRLSGWDSGSWNPGKTDLGLGLDLILGLGLDLILGLCLNLFASPEVTRNFVSCSWHKTCAHVFQKWQECFELVSIVEPQYANVRLSEISDYLKHDRSMKLFIRLKMDYIEQAWLFMGVVITAVTLRLEYVKTSSNVISEQYCVQRTVK